MRSEPRNITEHFLGLFADVREGEGTTAILLMFNLFVLLTAYPDAAGVYCHLKFPTIREDTLFSDRPELKDPSDGDIRDFYGPCDYDPLGKEEVLRQRADLQRERRRRYGSD